MKPSLPSYFLLEVYDTRVANNSLDHSYSNTDHGIQDPNRSCHSNRMMSIEKIPDPAILAGFVMYVRDGNLCNSILLFYETL